MRHSSWVKIKENPEKHKIFNQKRANYTRRRYETEAEYKERRNAQAREHYTHNRSFALKVLLAL